MAYYDFDDHFWSPQEVCGQIPQKNQPSWGVQHLIGSILELAKKIRLNP
ncbi:hypothetical protein [Microseira wollei]|uniref:Transposase n=1 Tax=Microseira wollei NIES-4236 TaxID=2530354 RepID=A0AAV3XGZ5_9CYAN|nr:hypothetical protein [Microseira wollei]GET39682.1 hypothetical protein MiSe_44540 [Microseira wollei NIES-4236]